MGFELWYLHQLMRIFLCIGKGGGSVVGVTIDLRLLWTCAWGFQRRCCGRQLLGPFFGEGLLMTDDGNGSHVERCRECSLIVRSDIHHELVLEC